MLSVPWIRVPVEAEALQGHLSCLPNGVLVERDRIEVLFDGAKEAVARLYALAQALVNDYERFEETGSAPGRGFRDNETETG